MTDAATAYKPDDSQSRRSIEMRMTLLEQRHSYELSELRRDLKRVEAAASELKDANATLMQSVHLLQLTVENLRSRTGYTATIASIITVAGFIIFDIIRAKLAG